MFKAGDKVKIVVSEYGIGEIGCQGYVTEGNGQGLYLVDCSSDTLPPHRVARHPGEKGFHLAFTKDEIKLVE